jgi:hypothetical protein
MTASVLLSRLVRVKQSRPGSWMSACPCCESRKGRPLAVTEKDDGRVLIHAFCGCTTEDVLGRLGLSVTDLFAEPLTHHAAPAAVRVPAGDVLASLTHEATMLAILANDIQTNQDVTDDTWERLATCAQRIGNAADYLNERAK